MRRLDYEIPEEYTGKTLSFIFEHVLRLSGYLIRRNKHIPGAVTLNGIHADVRTAVCSGDHLSILLSDTEKKSNVLPAAGPLNILYEDEDIIALNKRAEDIVHPDHAHLNNTLGNYLMAYYASRNDPADFHPVHRLDNGTSGLILAAKHSYAQNRLTEAMHSCSFERRYLALCHGVFEQSTGTIDAPIARPDPRSIRRCVREDGQSAITDYSVVRQLDSIALVSLRLHTGRTHQIRVHMEYLGHPLVGDVLYSAPVHPLISRPALHSHEARFLHPVTAEEMCLTAPLPEDMLRLMEDPD